LGVECLTIVGKAGFFRDGTEFGIKLMRENGCGIVIPRPTSTMNMLSEWRDGRRKRRTMKVQRTRSSARQNVQGLELWIRARTPKHPPEMRQYNGECLEDPSSHDLGRNYSDQSCYKNRECQSTWTPT
jgi:hypothetical protein